MSLQAKFALLLGVIGLTVTLAVGASLWAMSIMHNEVRRPFEIMSSALIELQTAKFAVESQREVLEAVRDQRTEDLPEMPAPLALFETEGRRLSAAMNTLVANEAVVTVTGKTSLANLRIRLAESRELSERWFTDSRRDDLSAAITSLDNSFELIRRIESRIIADTHGLLEHATDIRGRLLGMSAIVLLLVALTCTLGLLLVRRWVVRPVADLRAAAARIAAGDFLHRIPVRGFDEIGALSTEVNSMAGMVKTMQDEAVERERLAAVGEVVRRIAHNLRSPLAGIRGLAEISRRDLETPSVPTDVREDIGENQKRIISAVDRFEQWLRDLLDASRPLEVVHQTLDPRRWLAHVVEAYRPKARASSINLELDVADAPPLASFDPRHLEHALGALISNAMDAVAQTQSDHASRAVRISCRSIPSKDGASPAGWELEVRDNGPGVPIDLRERIFKPYFTTRPDGTGMGLALAQQVIRAHGGTLILVDQPHDRGDPGASAPGARGAVFSARMPRGPIDGESSGVAKAGHSEVPSGQNSRH